MLNPDLQVRIRCTGIFAALLYVASAHADAPGAHAVPDDKVVEVTATDYAFRAPDEIPSGWTTIRFKNEGEEPHFIFLSKLPDGVSAADYEREVSQPFAGAWYAMRDEGASTEEALGMIGEALPAWFGQLEFLGGPGYLSPGRTSETTLKLSPGSYVLECYMKTEAGEVHMMDGMLRPMTVTAEPSGVQPPDADLTVTLSNNEMAFEGEATPGRHTLAVHVVENPEMGFGHSVQVARLRPDADVDEIVRWMNWLSVDGMRVPAPAEFIGGAHPMPAGATAYVNIDLEPGRYLLISESTGHLGVLHELTVE